MRFIFPSIAYSDKIAYAHDSYNWRGHSGEVDRSCLQYETYGHGLTAHSPDYPILRDKFADYCYSLAEFLLVNQDHVESVSYDFRQAVDVRLIAFADSVRYKKPKDEHKYVKPTYYSMSEMKVTASDKKYDKRYEEVTAWMDGSPEAILRLLWRDGDSPLSTYRKALALYDWLESDRDRGWMQMPSLGEGVIDSNGAYDQHAAWQALQHVVKGLWCLEACKRGVSNYRSCLPKPEAVDTQAVTEGASS